jgi:hypothetical protein
MECGLLVHDDDFYYVSLEELDELCRGKSSEPLTDPTAPTLPQADCLRHISA